MDIIFKGRRTDVQERFREHAAGKLGKIEKLDRKAMRVDVEVSQERNPRLSGKRERVELTIRSRGPVVRAEAAADDRYAALDLALAKLETRLRRSGERRKSAKRLPAAPARSGGQAQPAAGPESPAIPPPAQATVGATPDTASGAAYPEVTPPDDVVPIQMEGDGPVVVREKFHPASPMTVSDALLQMELVGHDFYLFRDEECGRASVVYRRRGYQYGLIRLVEDETAGSGLPGGNSRPGGAREEAGQGPAWGGPPTGMAAADRAG